MSSSQIAPQYTSLIVSYLKSNDQKVLNKKEDLYRSFQVFSFLIEKATENESIGFETLFARLAYYSVKRNIPGRINFLNQKLRRLIKSGVYPIDEIPQIADFVHYLIWKNLELVSDVELPSGFNNFQSRFLEEIKKKRSEFQRVVKAIVFEYDLESGELVFIDEQIAHVKQKGYLTGKMFNKQMQKICKHLELPITVNFLDVEISDENIYSAKAFVFDPDLLVGVTSIAECFQSSGYTALKYLSRKLIPSQGSIHMAIGNIVNYYLDELIYNPELNFKSVIQNTFQIAPMTFLKLSDGEVLDTVSKLETHFNNLKEVVNEELKESGISKDKAYLEPSFFSNEYGIQGRLDLFHFDEAKNQSDIIELKSGKLFKPNGYGLNVNHYIQTLLYDLIVESNFNGKVKSNNYILYSALDTKKLKYAPRVRSIQYEAIKVRNDIVLLENLLCKIDEEDQPLILEAFNPDKIDAKFRFLKRDVKFYFDAFENLTDLEESYVKSFMGFISREFKLSKTGLHGIYKSNGLASLWLDPLEEKRENFTVLSFLNIEENNSDQAVPVIILKYSKQSNLLSKFRKGDIAVFYPYDGTEQAVLHNQVFKCTILSINSDQIEIRLRARQKNFSIFEKFEFWNIEGDVLDSGFNQLYYGLYGFMTSRLPYRRKILCLDPPDSAQSAINYSNAQMTEEQSLVLNKAINSKDYFLLWGPPGTGKTSVMIKSLVDYFYNHTKQSILLLAYTNRAVDEICSAIDQLLDQQFVRMGSRYSTNQKYVKNLLRVQTESLSSRAELKSFFSKYRIFVSTISSFQANSDYLSVTDFETVIVDEASQVLEPMLVGLLSSFKKFILIGDHKQLPAVVAQSDEKSICKSAVLKKDTGLANLRVSLFERMYKQCVKNNWDWAYGALTHQGRMHQDILQFISPEFYEGNLKILQGIDRLTRPYQNDKIQEMQKVLVDQRMIFIDTALDNSLIQKTNHEEAKLVKVLIDNWLDIYEKNAQEISDNSIGVITPFRSQIALIKDLISEIDEADKITVDTIERYQGGARDHIIISLAVNQADLLNSITNISEEGVDRKLNVALTRAKEHIVILGTKEVLISNPSYQRLIEHCYELDVNDLYICNRKKS